MPEAGESRRSKGGSSGRSGDGRAGRGALMAGAAALSAALILAAVVAGPADQSPETAGAGAGTETASGAAPQGAVQLPEWDPQRPDEMAGSLLAPLSLTGPSGETLFDTADGTPRAILLLDRSEASRQTLDSLNQTLADLGQQETRRYLLLVAEVEGSDTSESASVLDEDSWPYESYTASQQTASRLGFSQEDLPAWVFIYPDGTLAGRRQGAMSSDDYGMMTLLLAATIP